MITGVPDFKELEQTARGWIYLAWSGAISSLSEINGVSYNILLNQEANDTNKSAEKIAILVQSYNYALNNSVSLLQQSVELFLKARIAEVSPFLLINADVQSWPKVDKAGNVDFSDFRTIDAINLCKAVRAVSNRNLPDKFNQFYDDLRKRRNKIMHLTSGSIAPEVKEVLLLIMEAHNLLFDGQKWQEFRIDYYKHERIYDDDDFGEDVTQDIVIGETNDLIEALLPSQLKKYMGYDTRRKRLQCPSCESLVSKHFYEECSCAQERKDGSIYCFACLALFEDRKSYDDAMKKHFG